MGKRYIDADKIEYAPCVVDQCNGNDIVEMVAYKNLIDLMSTADVEEVRHGKWIAEIEDWMKWTCSECGWSERTDIHVRLGYNYCPDCGAKMDGGK